MGTVFTGTEWGWEQSFWEWEKSSVGFVKKEVGKGMEIFFDDLFPGPEFFQRTWRGRKFFGRPFLFLFFVHLSILRKCLSIWQACSLMLKILTCHFFN